jgi:hypothetical protein
MTALYGPPRLKTYTTSRGITRLGHWKKDNPLSSLRQFRVQQIELSYLTLDQIATLLDALKNSRKPPRGHVREARLRLVPVVFTTCAPPKRRTGRPARH